MSTYKDSGVSLFRGSVFVEKIQKNMKDSIFCQKQQSIDLTQFSGVYPLDDSTDGICLVASCDGIGTKLLLSSYCENIHSLGIDLVAMCVNDILVQGAQPLFFLDYLSVPHLDIDKYQKIINGILLGCHESGCILLGGETAEMPMVYKKDVFDMSGCIVGKVKKNNILPKKDIMKKGDAIIGIESSGIHANGFSLIHNCLSEEDFHMNCPWNNSQKIYESLLQPTKIYVSDILPLIHNNPLIKGAAHITGGGIYDNIHRAIPSHLNVHIDKKSWNIPPIFSWFQEKYHIDTKEMFAVFNMGIGFAIIVDKNNIDKVMACIPSQSYNIGYLTEKT